MAEAHMSQAGCVLSLSHVSWNCARSGGGRLGMTCHCPHAVCRSSTACDPRAWPGVDIQALAAARLKRASIVLLLRSYFAQHCKSAMNDKICLMVHLCVDVMFMPMVVMLRYVLGMKSV